MTDSYYCKWDPEESDTDDEGDDLQTSRHLTKASQILLLNNNEKSLLLENYVKRNLFRELVEVSYFVMRQRILIKTTIKLSCPNASHRNGQNCELYCSASAPRRKIIRLL